MISKQNQPNYYTFMENKEFTFKGMTVNGFLMLFVNLFLTILSIALIVLGVNIGESAQGITAGVGGGVLLLVAIIMWCGMMQLEPNEARVMLFFGKYKGTFTKVGFYWVNPFLSAKKLSMRARNLDVEPIKVNDKTGNPVMIGLMLVWKLKDTYKAMFEIDSQTMAQSGNQNAVGNSVSSIMKAFENFVKVQSDAALRQTAGLYAYDDNEQDTGELTLRSGGEEINRQLEEKLDERLNMAGIEIVEGAVSMVKMALQKLGEDNVVELDDDKKAAMVSNLMVVLCGDEPAQPVVNTGTLNH